ncbi:MAG: DNA-binding MarR family transcriptional regulator [Sphingobacteriales bacterium]
MGAYLADKFVFSEIRELNYIPSEIPALYVNDHLDFTSLKNLIGVTDVNLATRLKSLEKSNYVTFKKDFIDKKTNTKYFATLKGKQAFDLHIIAIEQLLNKKK